MVGVAKLKAHQAPPPVLSDLGKPLKESAALRREGKKDTLPSRVEVFELENSVVVAYVFPLSAEIGKKDEAVEFSALIGRLQVSQHFLVEAMQFQGKLQL